MTGGQTTIENSRSKSVRFKLPADIKRYIVHTQVELDLDKENGAGYTPLHRAVKNGNTDAVRALLASGAEIDKTDKRGRTPLDLARQKKHREIVKILKKARKETSHPDNSSYVDTRSCAIRSCAIRSPWAELSDLAATIEWSKYLRSGL